MNKKGMFTFFPPQVIVFILIIFILGFISMVWLPGQLETKLKFSKDIANIFSTIFLLLVLGILRWIGVL